MVIQIAMEADTNTPAMENDEGTHIPTDELDGTLPFLNHLKTEQNCNFNTSISSCDETLYKVECRTIKEEPIVPRSSLGVYVSPGGEVKRLSWTPGQEGDEIDHTRSDDQTSCCLESCEKLVPSRRKIKLLEINGDSDFCQIETFTYHYDKHKHKHHYIKSADVIEGTGLKPQDELISVNEKSLTNLNQKDVSNIFKRIKPEEGASDIKMHLTLWRWKKMPEPASEDVWTEVCRVEIWLTLVPVTGPSILHRLILIPVNIVRWARSREPRELVKSCTAFKVGNAREQESDCRVLNPGCIRDIGVKCQDNRTKLKMNNTDFFLESRADGQLVSSVLQSNASGEFWRDIFFGADESPSPLTKWICCFRLYKKSPEGDCFLMSNLQEKVTTLCFKARPNDDIKSNIDERCFIYRALGGGKIFESLIYRENFIHYDAATETFNMKYISHTLMDAWVRGLQDESGRGEQFRQAERELDGCWFSCF